MKPENPPPTEGRQAPVDSPSSAQEKRASSYWKANLTVVGILLSVWFIVGYVISIFAIEPVNSIKLGNLGLGFWFAQQGSILVFVALVWLYAILMDVVDRKYQNSAQQKRQ